MWVLLVCDFGIVVVESCWYEEPLVVIWLVPMIVLLKGENDARLSGDTVDEGGVQVPPKLLETGVFMNAPSVCVTAESLPSV